MSADSERNARVKRRYDELMREGRHGHYESMFRVVREEIELNDDLWEERARWWKEAHAAASARSQR